MSGEHRSVTLGTKQLKAEKRRDVRLNGERPAPEHIEHPKTRGECEGHEGPCPLVGCRYHLYADINPQSGSLKVNFPDRQPEDMPPASSCALDVADQGGLTLDQVAAAMNVTRERVRQIESRALRSVAQRVDEDLVPKKFLRQCKAVDGITGRSCRLLEHNPGTPHRSERGEFHVVAAPGQTRFEHQEQLDRRARSNPPDDLEPNHV